MTDVTAQHPYQEGSAGCTTCGLSPGAAVHNIHEHRAADREEKVNHPLHYGGESNPYEAIKVIEAWALGFCLGNAVKYICRAGKKTDAKTLDDLRKARWYLDREIKSYEDHGA